MNEPVYNCGCFWWMHGTVDTCDLYLPDRKPASDECPLVAECRRREDYYRLRREHDEYALRGMAFRSVPILLASYTDPAAYTTATGAQMAYQQAMQNIERHSLWEVLAKSGTRALG